MILSDADLKKRLEQGDLIVETLDETQLQIQPASIELRLGHHFLRCRRRGQPPESIDVWGNKPLVLQSGDFVLGTTFERVRIPDDLVARVEGRGSIGRRGLQVHATAGFIDPGFYGQITLELSTLSTYPVELVPLMRVCQIVLYQMKSPAERPYGSARGTRPAYALLLGYVEEHAGYRRSLSPWGEDMYEWWCGGRKLTVYLGCTRSTYVKAWGDDIVDEMEDGEIHLPEDFAALWQWLNT